MSAGRPSLESPRRALALRLVVIAGAIGAGLCLQQVLAARLEAIDALSRQDLLAARAELATLLRVVGVLVFGMTGSVGISMLLASRKALEAGQFPPPGAWSWGAARITRGERARTLARVGMALGVAVAGCSAAGGWMMWFLAARLLACRAGVG
ncbi:MAG TPA: hypothetical protein VLL75_10360 [Vicinamibacteria bacterium]|nr:hypothetical protein [Vicinamibacteria bacterium]